MTVDAPVDRGVQYWVSGAVANIRLMKPERLNAVSNDMLFALGEAAERADRDEAVRVLLLTGEGRAFCAGADLKVPDIHGRVDLSAHLKSPAKAIEILGTVSKPVVAGVQGHCVGAGVEILAATDIAVAATDALFSMPQVSLGILPSAGMARIVRRIGLPWATRLVLTGERVDALRAQQVGLVTEVVPPEQLAERVSEIAELLVAQPREAQIIAKESLVSSLDSSRSAAVAADLYRQFALLGREDSQAAHDEFRAHEGE